MRIDDPDEEAGGDGIRWYARVELLGLIRDSAKLMGIDPPDDLEDLGLPELGWKFERMDKFITGWGNASTIVGYGNNSNKSPEEARKDLSEVLKVQAERREMEWREFADRNGLTEDRELAVAA